MARQILMMQAGIELIKGFSEPQGPNGSAEEMQLNTANQAGN